MLSILKKKQSFLIFLTFAFIVACASGFVYTALTDVQPCMLCLLERLFYFLALPFLVGLYVCIFRQKHQYLQKILFLCISLLMLINLLVSFFHMGVDQNLWSSPVCNYFQTEIPKAQSPEELLQQLAENHQIGSCNNVSQHKFFNISLLWWNCLIAFCLGNLALYGAFLSRKP